MVKLPDLRSNERIIYESEIGSPWMYVVAIWLCFVPPWLLGPLYAYLTRRANSRSRVWITNQRILKYRDMFWPFKPSTAELELSWITKAGANRMSEFMGGEFTLFERLWGVASLEVFYEEEGVPAKFDLENLKKRKRFVSELNSALSKLEFVPEDSETQSS